MLPIKIVRQELKLPVGIYNPHPSYSVELSKVAAFKKQIRTGVLIAAQFQNKLVDSHGTFGKPQRWGAECPGEAIAVERSGALGRRLQTGCKPTQRYQPSRDQIAGGPRRPNRLRTNVYVDGFNLYYGAVRRTPYKWLNIRHMCELTRPSVVSCRMRPFTCGKPIAVV